MTVLEALLNRKSTPPRLMDDQGPSPADVQDMMCAAMTAPDHGAIRPWRFVIIEGEDRAMLGQVFAEALRRRDPNATEEAIAKEVGRPLRAPTVIAILARVTLDRPNVPPVEQIVAAGCAAQNMLLAAEAKGFGAILLTGKNAQDSHVKAFFDMKNEDEIIGFLYVGRAAGPVPDKERMAPEGYIEPFGKGAAA